MDFYKIRMFTCSIFLQMHHFQQSQALAGCYLHGVSPEQYKSGSPESSVCWLSTGWVGGWWKSQQRVEEIQNSYVQVSAVGAASSRLSAGEVLAIWEETLLLILHFHQVTNIPLLLQSKFTSVTESCCILIMLYHYKVTVAPVYQTPHAYLRG